MAEAPRVLYAAFAASLGAGLALIAYRFAMQPLVWNSPAKTVLQIGAPLLPIATWQVLRQYERVRWPALLAVLGFVVGAGVAFGAAYAIVPPPGAARLTTREFPGFSIGMPSGDEKDRNDGDATGKLELVDVEGTGGVVAVRWEPGGALDASEMNAMTAGLSSAVGGGTPSMTKLPGPGGTEVDTVAFDSAKGPMWVSIIVCGARRVTVNTGGSALESIHRRMVASLVCHPGAAPKAATEGFPLALDIPDGWHQMPGEPGQIQLTDGSRALILREFPETLKDLDKARALLTSAFEASGVHLTFGEMHDQRIPFTGMSGSDAILGWIWPYECANRSILVMAIVSDQASSDSLVELVKKAHCAAPGEVVRFPK